MTPNIEKIAASGVRFDRAYCQQATNLRAYEMNMYADADVLHPKDYPDALRKRLIHGYHTATSYANVFDDPVHVDALRHGSEELQQRIAKSHNSAQSAKLPLMIPSTLIRRHFDRTHTPSVAVSMAPHRLFAEAEYGRKLGIALAGLGGYGTGQLSPALKRNQTCRLAGVVTGSTEKGRKIVGAILISQNPHLPLRHHGAVG